MMTAKDTLSKATKCQRVGRIFQSYHYFHAGINMLTNQLEKEENTEAKSQLIGELKKFMEQAEKVKAAVHKQTTCGTMVESLSIAENSEKHGYESVFAKYFDQKIIEIILQEPRLATVEEFENLIAFLEVVVIRCTNLKFLRVVTNQNDKEEKQQQKYMAEIKKNVARYGICMFFVLEKELKKCKMAFNDGVIIKVQPSLHYFKYPSNKIGLSVVDYDFRKCKKTVISIFSIKKN